MYLVMSTLSLPLGNMQNHDLAIIHSAQSIRHALGVLREMTLGDAANNGYIEKIIESQKAISEMEKLFLQIVANRT